MAEYIPKTDAEIEREDLLLEKGERLHETEQEDFKPQHKKSPMENPYMRTLAFVISAIAAFLLFLFMIGLLLFIFLSRHQNVMLD